MAAIRCQVVLHTVDNFPANYITNTFAMEVAASGAQTAGITARLKTFYDGLSTLFAGTLAQSGHEVKFTDLPGLVPNYPWAQTTFSLAAAPSGNPLPSEVAIALSFQGAKFAGLPQARRRGRIYLGPLKTTAADTTGRPAAGIRTSVATAAASLLSGLQAEAPPVNWSVWSQVDGDVVNITDGWIDDAFDTQRRRGVETTARTLWT